MKIMAVTLVLLVAALHIYFLVLEMFLWTKPLGQKVFKNSQQRAEDTRVLAANQGLYNGFLSAGLIWGLLYPDPFIGKQIQFFFLACVMVAGLYGAYSVGKKVLFVQFGPALIASLFLFF
jgi:putative membrane protein